MASHQGGRPPDGGIQAKEFHFKVEMQPFLNYSDGNKFFITPENDPQGFQILEQCLRNNLSRIQEYSKTRSCGQPISIDKSENFLLLEWSVASLAQLEAIPSNLQDDLCKILKKGGIEKSLDKKPGTFGLLVDWKPMKTISDGKRHFAGVPGSVAQEHRGRGIGTAPRKRVKNPSQFQPPAASGAMSQAPAPSAKKPKAGFSSQAPGTSTGEGHDWKKSSLHSDRVPQIQRPSHHGRWTLQKMKWSSSSASRLFRSRHTTINAVGDGSLQQRFGATDSKPNDTPPAASGAMSQVPAPSAKIPRAGFSSQEPGTSTGEGHDWKKSSLHSDRGRQPMVSFRVYVPDDVRRKNHMKSVVVIRNEDSKSEMKPNQHDERIWEVTLPFHSQFSYYYAFTDNPGNYNWKATFSGKHQTHEGKEVKQCSTPDTKFDFILDCKNKSQEEQRGYCAHISTLVKSCDPKDLQEASGKLSRCIRQMKQAQKLSTTLLTELWERLPVESPSETELTLLVLIFLECYESKDLKSVIDDCKYLRKLFSDAKAQKILSSCLKLPQDLLSLHNKGLHQLIDYLCTNTKGTHCCFLVNLYHCLRLPALSETELEEKAWKLENIAARERHETSFPLVHTGMPDSHCKEMFLYICTRLRAIQRDAARRLMDKICKFFPFKILFLRANELQKFLGNERLIQVLKSKLDIDIEQKEQYADLMCVLNDCQEMCKNNPEILQRIQKLFITYFSSERSPDDARSSDCGCDLLHCDFLWDDTFFSEMSKNLSQSNNKGFHSFFTLLMKSQVAKNVKVRKAQELASEWIGTARKLDSDDHESDTGGPASHGSSYPYRYLQDAMTVPAFQQAEVKRCLEERVYSDYAKKCPILKLLKSVCSTRELEDEKVEEVMIQHLTKRVQEDSGSTDYWNNIEQWMGETSTSDVTRERIKTKVLRLCLDNCGIEQVSSDEKAMLQMTSRAAFWLYICKLPESLKTSVKDHPSFKRGMDVLQKVMEAITKKNISCMFVREVDCPSNKKPFASLLACVDTDGKCMGSFTECTVVLESAEKLLDTVIKVFGKIPSKMQDSIPALAQIVTMVEKRVSELKTEKVHISEIEQKSAQFDDILTKLRQICATLEELGDSELFWSINKEIFQQENANPVASCQNDSSGSLLACICQLWCEESPTVEKESVLEVLSAFTTAGLDQYEHEWRPLFEGDNCPLKGIKRIVLLEDLQKEIAIARKHHGKSLPKKSDDGLKMYVEVESYAKKVKAATATLQALKCCANDDAGFRDAVKSVRILQKREGGFENICVHDLAATLQSLQLITNAKFAEVLEELARGKGLVDFLKSVIKEDLRNWIDAVEDHSEQYVQESTVSNLIDVRRYLHQVLQDDLAKKTVEEIFFCLSKQMDQFKDLPKKIKDCTQNLHGLKNLLSNMANRGEATKQVVLQTVCQSGANFLFHLEQGHCNSQLRYTSSGNDIEMRMEDVLDLRSRVLLLMNTEGRGAEKIKGADDARQAYPKFVQYVDDAVQIADMIQALWQLAHPDFYPSIPLDRIDVVNLSKELERLSAAQQSWEDELRYCRSKYQGLNYFFPDQLWKIFSFFKTNDSTDEIFALLQYAGYDTAAVDQACKSFPDFEPVLPKLQAFRQIGQALDEISGHVNFTFPDFPEACFAHAKLKGMDKIEKGQLFIAALDENSSQVIPTLLTLYQNTTGSLPLPHQVLFCREDTVWEEIKLLLLRCSGANTRLEKQLFCLVHVEKLSNKLQYRLVDELVLFCKEDFSYFFVICRGNIRHPFIDHFSEVVHHVQPMSPKALDACFQELFPEVEVVTSNLPGQGKTEVIREMAHKEELKYICLQVSGDFRQSAVMKTLEEMNITPEHLIHIDLALVSDPLELDTLIFQMVVLQCLNYRSTLCRIPTKHIKIEVANTINDILLNSLKTTLHFRRRNLCWNNFTDFKFSMEICSPEQVVCHYLKARDSGQVGKTDLVFTGKAPLKPLPGEECRRILQKQFESSTNLSFTAVHLFLSILADQLKKLSCSSFMNVASLTEMAGEQKVEDIRTSFMAALVDVVEEFSSRSVQACRSAQTAAVSLTSESASKEDFLRAQLMSTEASASAMTSRVDSMIRWSDSNHLVIIFHNQDIQTLSALYRDLRLVPPHVRKLFETQIKKDLPDFSTVNQDQLQQIVQRVARSSPDSLPEAELQKLNSSYALTPDNVLKMILIILRVKANVPVIIMGETGCGKTSLFRYLAAICGVDFQVMNVHAGTTDEEIVDFVKAAHAEATKNLMKQVWVFLDEINTCRHTGLINEVVCHHQCLGRPLAPNLVLMAACNPYKLRNQTSIHTAGLESKVKVDEQSKLVYRVHPLPESMVDYVWDYGTLSSGTNKSDEGAYIAGMVSGILAGDENQMIVEALVVSQAFIRQVEQNDFCVSLRDVNRFRILFEWFQDKLPVKEGKERMSHSTCQAKAVLLAFAHVYHCRLPDNDKRRQYRTELSQIFSRYGWICREQEAILDEIDEEQKDLLHRMEVPEGTAKNTALQENVFVVLNCILNRMPVFLVGKPGCSKSLSLQLIKSNLRGKDSDDDYFKCLPQLYFVSYQGSESSTSEGILKVFEKARKYREANKQEDVLPVVILDEIGLAEMSRFNPLKVLHSLLEPGEQELPDVAVVGVSNWALDAAKMNRASHLSRPDMDREELYRTGVSISEACVDNTSMTLSMRRSVPRNPAINKPLLKAIATAYDEYRMRQTIPNFHGLRDYYSLIKHIARAIKNPRGSSNMAIVEGLLRNLGGVPDGFSTLKSIFQPHLQDIDDDIVEELREFSVLQLVKQNLNDKVARHLLLITHGDIALSILETQLKTIDPERNFVTILGSKFAEDLTDDYNYRIISRIILHMEQGVVLILKDLESIYGSLYDMLNQNYTVVGTKRNCRIASGPYSNPLCQVHEDFRCIVLIEEQKLDLSDPPFLNRFEKQRLTLQDILEEEEKSLAIIVEHWLLALNDHEKKLFKINDLLPIYGADLVPSLVHHVCLSTPEKTREEKLKLCEDLLLQMFTPDGMLRASTSQQAKTNYGLFQDLLSRFLALPLHSGLSHYVESLCNTWGIVKSIVVTHSNPHTDVASCMAATSNRCQVERLGALKSEKQLSARSEQFWTDVDKEWLIFQCSVSTDMGNFLLLKTTLEKHIQQYSSVTIGPRRKNVMIVLHLDRTQRSSMLEVINFLMGWHLAFLDVLEKPDTSLNDFLGKTVLQLIQERDCVVPFVECHLFWAFTRINYISSERNIQSLQEIMEAVLDDEDILTFITNKILSWLEHNDKARDEEWTVEVACNVAGLQSASTLLGALEHELQRFMEHPLAGLIFLLENMNALDPLRVDQGDKKKKNLWLQIARDTNIIDISQIEAPIGPECYPCHTPQQGLWHPFSRVFFNRIESLREQVVASKHARLGIATQDEFDPLPEGFLCDVCNDFHDLICRKGGYMIEEQYEKQKENYLHDFAMIISEPAASVQFHSCQWVMQWLLMKYVGDLGSCSFADFVVRLHCSFWLQEALIQTEYALISTCVSMTRGSDDRGLQCIAGFFDHLTAHDSEAGMENAISQPGQLPVRNTVSPFLPSSEHDSCDDEPLVERGQEGKETISPERVELFLPSLEGTESETIPLEQGLLSTSCNECQHLPTSHSPTEFQDFMAEASSDGDSQGFSATALANRQNENAPEPNHMASDTYGTETGPERSEDLSHDEVQQVTNVMKPSELESGEIAEMAIDSSALPDVDETEEGINASTTNSTADSVGIFRTVGSVVALNEDLANIACRRLIPSDSVLKAGEMSLETWQHTVSMVLSLEKKISLAPSRVSISSAVSQSLQVALDFQSCLSGFIPTEEEQRALLTKLGQRLAEDGILSRSVFDFLLQLFDNPIFSKASAREALSHFFATYVTSCLRVDDEDNTLPFCWSLEKQTNYITMDHLKFFGPPLHCAFLLDIEPCFKDIQDLFTNDEMVRESVSLCRLDDCLHTAHETSTHIMSLCVDVIEHFFLPDMQFTPQDPSFLELLHESAACIMAGTFSLKIVLAVALLRKSMALMANKILTTTNRTAAEVSAVQRLDKVMSSFSNEPRRQGVNPLQRNFIKLLLQGGGTKTLHGVCSLLKDCCSLLGQLPLDHDSSVNSLDFHMLESGLVYRTENPVQKAAFPFSPSSEYDSIQEALLHKVKSKTELPRILQSAAHGGQVLYTVLAVALKHFYLVKSIRPMLPSEKDQVCSFSEICKNTSLPENLNRLVDFISGQEVLGNFTLTESSTEMEFQVASVFAHITCKIIAFNPGNINQESDVSFWVKCLQTPETLNSLFFPATLDTSAGFQAFCFLPWLPLAGEVVICECKCGTYIATKGSTEESFCQLCKDVNVVLCREEKVCSIAGPGDLQEIGKKGYLSIDPDSLKNPALAVRQLSPCAFRVLHLLIQCCLLGSVALGFTTREKLQRLLQTPAEGDVTETLYQQLLAHWEVLASLTNLGPAQLGRFVHILIDQCFDANLPKSKDLVEFNNRNRMEKAWSTRVDGFVDMRFTLLKNQAKNHIKEKFAEKCIVLESLTEEAAQGSEDCISSLFRETLPPSIFRLKAEYILQRDTQIAHPFIGLVLAKETQLALLCCLQPVLSWHMMTVRMISYHLKKDEARKMMVYEYIHSIPETDRRKVVQNTFDAYQEAWDKLRSHKELLQKYFRPSLGSLEEVSIDSRLDECLALSSSSPMLQVLKALTEMHNEFLNDAVILSLQSGSPSLGFLKQDAQRCCLKSVPLELVSRKQLIQLKLADQHVSEMRFSQNCTQFGMGRKIEYNFYQYEMKWAHDLLMGAHYLSMGLSFPQVVFSGEILQRSASLLQDVNDVVPQCDLDREMKKSVQAFRERNPAHLRGLLGSLEMAMSLLKKTSGQGVQDMESTSQYLERWSALLDLPSPDIMGFLKQVKLSQITGLFEFVEGLQAAMISEALAVEYRTELPAKSLQTLNESVVSFTLNDLELLLQALQKFALRYLASPSPGLDDQLYLHVQDPSLWPRTSLGEGRQCKAMSLVPHQLYVEHIHALLVYLEEAITNMKQQMEKTWISNSAAQSKKKSVEEEKRAKKKNVRRF